MRCHCRIIAFIFSSETATTERYRILIMNLISLLEADEPNHWFQQVGPTAHTANSTMQTLSEFFGGRIVYQNLWPPGSPDLSPTDFHL